MKFLSTRAHGALDYLMGAVLLVAPYVLGFANGGAAQWIPMILGAGAIVYSLLTRYELGAVKLIPVPVHLVLDAASGLLVVSPCCSASRISFGCRTSCSGCWNWVRAS